MINHYTLRHGVLGTMIAAVAGVLVAPWAAEDGRAQRHPRATPSAAAKPASYDVTRRGARLIAPGTIVGEGPSKGWSHLVVKSRPRVTSGDVEKTTRMDRRIAARFGTAFLAHVHRPEGAASFSLGPIAVGITTRVGERDMIVSPRTQGNLGAGLGFLDRLVLKEMYSVQQQVTEVVRSPTMVLVDTPVVLRHNNKNREMIIRYALLADESTGGLETFCWVIETDAAGRYVGSVGSIQWLPPNKLMDAALYVDKNEYTLGIPSNRAFAIMAPPKGRKRVSIPDDAARIVCKKSLTAKEALATEQWFRSILRQVSGDHASR